MINMFAIVEMNGCILNLAMKNPAIIANTVVRMIHAHTVLIMLLECSHIREIKNVTKYTTGVNSVMHNNGCCNHTHTNHTSYRKVGTC